MLAIRLPSRSSFGLTHCRAVRVVPSPGQTDTRPEQPERPEDMSATVDLPQTGLDSAVPQPLVLSKDYGIEDRIFRGGVRLAGYFVLLLLFLIGLFLFLSLIHI